MKTILFAVACMLATSGCSKKSDKAAGGAQACAPAIDKAIDGMMASRKQMIAQREKAGQPAPPGMLEGMQEIADKLRGVLTTSCEADKWSETVITCFANASDQPGIKKCREGLPPDQAQRLQAEIIKVMGGGAAPGGHGPKAIMNAHPEKLQGSAGAAAPAGSAAPAGADASAAGSAK